MLEARPLPGAIGAFLEVRPAAGEVVRFRATRDDGRDADRPTAWAGCVEQVPSSARWALEATGGETETEVDGVAPYGEAELATVRT